MRFGVGPASNEAVLLPKNLSLVFVVVYCFAFDCRDVGRWWPRVVGGGICRRLKGIARDAIRVSAGGRQREDLKDAGRGSAGSCRRCLRVSVPNGDRDDERAFLGSPGIQDWLHVDGAKWPGQPGKGALFLGRMMGGGMRDVAGKKAEKRRERARTRGGRSEARAEKEGTGRERKCIYCMALGPWGIWQAGTFRYASCFASPFPFSRDS